jgi:hypothetical protein
MIMTELTRQELHILRHSLGLDDTGRGSQYRNSYVLGPDCPSFATLKYLEARGLMTDHGPRAVFGGMHGFTVTPAGRAIAATPDRLPRKERGRRIYRFWLSISDCFPDSTFRDFLTEPEFAGARERARQS